MRRLRRTVWKGFICLTAFMSLAASTPHFVCRCPNGQVKPFCLGPSSKTTGCCCGGACCCASGQGQDCCCRSSGTATGGEGKKAACCCCSQHRKTPVAETGQGLRGHRHQLPAESSGTVPQFKSTCCVKTLAQQSFVAATHVKTTISEDVTPGRCLLADSGLAALFPGVGRFPAPWQVHLLPPPTDLVITLQHFLI